MRWFHYLLSWLAGASLTLAFAPFEFRLLVIVSPALFFWLLLQASERKHFLWLSWLYGFGLFATGASWIFYSMYFFAHAHILLAIGLTSLFVLFMALFFLPFGWLAWYFRHQPPTISLALVFPALWVLAEWFRGWFLSGFPWLYLGHAHIDNLLGQTASLGGSLLVSLLSALLSGLLLLFIIGDKQAKITTAIGTLLIAALGFIADRIEWTEATGEPLQVALLQGNIPQQDKWKPEYLLPTLERYQQMTDRHWDKDLIIWPETALPDFFNKHMDNLILPLQEKSRQQKTDVLLGGFYYNKEGKAGAENSILAISDSGRQVYSKQHLVPFSEYIPFLDYLRWLENWIQLPYDSVKRGTGATILDVAGYRAKMSVCYEDAYGNKTIAGIDNAHMLINVSNDGWFSGSIEPDQHMEIARMRSIESGRYLLRSTNIGISGIVDHKGAIRATAPGYTIRSIVGTVQPRSGITLYARTGNILIIIIALLMLSSTYTSKWQRQ